jgi:hypothetical protein
MATKALSRALIKVLRHTAQVGAHKPTFLRADFFPWNGTPDTALWNPDAESNTRENLLCTHQFLKFVLIPLVDPSPEAVSWVPVQRTHSAQRTVIRLGPNRRTVCAFAPTATCAWRSS